jgi:eukaryotic-like serine/threonine-protein kinase
VSGEGQLIADRYRFLDRIGSGAMGVVWRAQDERLGRIVAVKQLLLQAGMDTREHDEAIQRAMREGRIAAKLHHPNAIAVYDVVEENGAPCLVMEYLPSYSLADTLSEYGALDPLQVARIGSQAASALAAAHAAGIVHRDVKPGNVLIADSGLVKITDFGISRASDDITVTKTGLIAGTPAYLAPEIARGSDPTPASDVFSLGSTLYAAAEGEPPFGLSENTLGVLHAVAAGRINPPAHDGPLTDVLLRLLNVDPAERPTMGQARELLAAVASGRNPSLTGLRAASTPGVLPVAGPTTVLDPNRTRVVSAGTGYRAGGPQAQPRTVGPTRAVAPPPSSSNKPLAIAAAVLVLLLAVGGLLVALGAFKSDPQVPAPNPSSSSAKPSVTTSPTPKPTTTTETTRETTTEEPTTTTNPPTTTTPKPTTTVPKPTTTVPTTTTVPPTTTTVPPITSSSA